MAILEKRRAVNQLPRFQRYQDTRAGDRAAALRGETPITSAIRQLAGSSGYGPMGDSQGFNPMGGGMGGRGGAGPMGGGMGGGMGGAGKGTVDKFGNVAGQPKTAVTSALKGATAAEKNAIASKAAGTGAAGTTSKLPGLTSKTTDATGKTITSTGTGAGKTAGVTGSKTLTSPGTGTAKTTGTTGAKTTGSSGSSLSKTLTSALTGAALGAGTKFVIDKLTGKKTSDSGVSGTGASSGTGLTSKTNPFGTKIGTSIVDTGVKKVVDKVTGTGTAKTAGTAGTGVTSVIKGADTAGTAGNTKTTKAGTAGTVGTIKTGTAGTTGVVKKVTDDVTKGVTKKVSDTVAKKVTDGVTSAVKPKSPVTPASKTGTPKTGTPKTGGAGTKTAGSETKTRSLSSTPTADKTSAGTPADPSLGLPEGAIDNGDGTYTVGNTTYSMENDAVLYTIDADGAITLADATEGGAGVAYDDDGNLMPGYELDENGDAVFVGDATSTIYDPSGGSITSDTKTINSFDTTTQVMDDGTVVTLDANGDIVSYTDTDGVEYDADGNEIVSGGGDGGEDGDGSDEGGGGETTETLDDGTVITYDEDGDIVSYTDTDGVIYDGDGNEIVDDSGGGDGSDEEEIVADEEEAYDGLYSDDEGNLYDAEGNFVQYADGTMAGEEEFAEGAVAYTDEYGNTYDYNGDLLEEGDYSDYVQYDEDGNSYNFDGELIDYAEGYDPAETYTADDEFTFEDEYASDDEYSYEDDYSYDDLDYGKKGGLIHMENGGDVSEEDGEPIEEEENEDGTITQYFDDGSSITYGEDGEVNSVTDTEGVEESGGGDSNNAELQTRGVSSNGQLTADEMLQILDDRKISRQAMERQQIEDDFNAEESLANYRARNGLPPLTTSTSVPVSEQNLQGKKYFSDGSYILFDKFGTPVQTADADGNLSLYSPDIKPSVNSQATATLARDPNYSNTTEKVQDFQNVGYNFGELDDSTMTGYTGAGNRNPVGNTYTGLSDAVNTSPPEGWPEGFVSNDDGTATYVDDDGSTVTIDVDSNIVFVTDAYGDVVAQDGEAVTTGGLGQANQNIQYFDDGSYIQTFDDGTSITFDADGNPFRATDSEGNSQLANTTSYDDDGNQTISDYYGNIVKVLDPQGNVIPMGGGRISTAPITNVGSTGAVGTDTESAVQKKIEDQQVNRDTKSAIDDLLAGLNTYGGAGAAGAVLGALLSDTDLFGGGGGGHSFDMTGVGAIDPRTTDFGIGPANYVGYDQYGTPEQMPELYGRELYQNLNAPGFNEVNPGDYAQYDEEEFGSDDMYLEEPMDEVQPMAEGGMPTGGLGQTYPETYYTFGTPVDPLQNLRNPAPYQPQQPQMQPQMPPQAAQNAQQAPMGMQPMGMMPQMPPMAPMPQMSQGMPPAGMKRGGLPALSNVPITQGRLNFRQGAAVHGPGDGQSDDIPAMLADGEYVIDADTVAQIGNGSTKAGAQALDKFRENIRMHKRSAPVNKIPPKTKALTSYLKGAR